MAVELVPGLFFKSACTGQCLETKLLKTIETKKIFESGYKITTTMAVCKIIYVLLSTRKKGHIDSFNDKPSNCNYSNTP